MNRSVTLTIFSDFATVRDIRTLTLAQGVNHIGFPNISPQVVPQTAFFADVASNHPVWVVEQNFNANVLSGASLLQASVGKPVTIIVTNPTTGRESRERATILSVDGPILQFADRVETGLPPFGRIVYPAIPSGLLPQPSFEADIGSTGAGTPRIALTYLTNGFSWSADYVMRLNAGVERADLDVLATVANNSGASYDNATLQLVSGNVQRAAAETLGTVQVRASAAVATYATDGSARPTRQPLLEFYLYTVPHTTTLADKQMKQFTLLSARNVPVTQTFEVNDVAGGAYSSAVSGESVSPVNTYVKFTNQGRELGIPLPSGVVHMYKNDATGNAEFVGEDSIDRTPKLATVVLGLGQSYDLSARHIQTEFHQVVVSDKGPTYDYSSHRITLANAKSKAVTAKVFEYLPLEWTIQSETAPHTKLSSGRVEWVVNVPAEGSTKIDYTVRVKE